MSERPDLHVGTTPWRAAGAFEPTAWVEQAVTAEQAGFDSFWLPESHFVGDQASPAPLLVLTAAAARTTRLQLGTTSFLLPIRPPILVAEEVATLERLSGGRVIFGVGRGFRRELFEVFGVDSREKREIFEQSLSLIRRAWAGESVLPPTDDASDAAGRERRAVVLSPLPEREPPIWVAAFGPKALRQVASLGLPYLASPIESNERLIENYRLHREHLPGEVEADSLAVPAMRTVFASVDGALCDLVRDSLHTQAMRMARSSRGRLGDRFGADVDDWAIIGSPSQVVDRVVALRERPGLTHLVVRGGVPGIEETEVRRSLDLIREAL